MITIETYSERGMVLRGDLERARQIMAEAAPKAMATEQRGGLVVSRKYEARIREALARMGLEQRAPERPVQEPDEIPYPLPKRQPGAASAG